jgi:hypothetical protein
VTYKESAVHALREHVESADDLSDSHKAAVLETLDELIRHHAFGDTPQTVDLFSQLGAI